MLDRAFLNRIRLMNPWEIPMRAVELMLDYIRFIFRRVSLRSFKAVSFTPPVERAAADTLQTLWDSNPWHEEALSLLLDGKIEITGRHYSLIEGPERWRYCPDHRHTLPMIMGRRFLFVRMYRDANMQFIGTLNRHYHLVHLAKAAALGRIDRHAVLSEIIRWIDENPYMEGVNWSDCLNHAVRIVNWCLVFTYLDLEKVPAAISRSLHQQGLFIEKHLSFGSSAGNHLLGELWGLFFLGTCFPGLPRAARWRRMAVERLQTEFLKQFAGDGLHRERSLSYHRYLVEYLMLAALCAKRCRIPLGDAFHHRLHKALRALAELINARGEVPFLGDHGHEITTDIHYLSFWHTNLYHSTLRMGAILFADPELKSLASPDQEDARIPWLFPEDALDEYRKLPCRPPTRHSTAFPETGLYILRDGAPFHRETSLIIRCGEMGYQSLCAHAHADMLSFVLSVRGKQFLIDPGTYGYHFKGPKWRNYFRGTTAHNTLTVEQMDQADSGGAMMWLNKPTGYTTTWRVSDERDQFEGWHDGYLRLRENPVKHIRRVTLDKTRRCFEISDRIDANQPARVDLYFHFHPGVELRLSGNRAVATRDGDTITLDLPEHTRLDIHRGDREKPLGWYSPYFGIIEPTNTLVVSRRLSPEEPMLTRIAF
jgi:hypothetical protein